MLQGTDEQAVSDVFSEKLLFHGKEEFFEKCTSKRRNQARQSKFASGKPTGKGRNEPNKRQEEKIERGKRGCYKW